MIPDFGKLAWALFWVGVGVGMVAAAALGLGGAWMLIGK